MGKGEKERAQGGLLEWLGAFMPWLIDQKELAESVAH